MAQDGPRWGQDGEHVAQDANDDLQDAAQERQEAIFKDVPSVFTTFMPQPGPKMALYAPAWAQDGPFQASR